MSQEGRALVYLEELMEKRLQKARDDGASEKDVDDIFRQVRGGFDRLIETGQADVEAGRVSDGPIAMDRLHDRLLSEE